MFCPNCGKALEEGSVFCDGCGTKVVEDASANASAAYEAPKATSSADVSFGEACKLAVTRIFDYSGRSGVKEFWFGIIFLVICSAGLGVLYYIPYLGAAISSLGSIGLCLMEISMIVRRLRDVGLSWTNIFRLFIPIAGVIMMIIRCVKPTDFYGHID